MSRDPANRSAAPPKPGWAGRLRRATYTALAIYVVVLVASTHWPSPPEMVATRDKLLHIGAYSVLAWLVALAIGWTGRARARHYAIALVGLALFAVADEVTQPWFDRNAEFLDWVADMGGVVVGMGLGLLTTRQWAVR